MAVNVAPQATHAVEVFASVDVDQRATLRSVDDERTIVGHLRKGMPHDLAIPIEQFIARGSFFVSYLGRGRWIAVHHGESMIPDAGRHWYESDF